MRWNTFSLTPASNIDTYIYINTVVAAVACATRGNQANNPWISGVVTSTACEQESTENVEGVLNRTGWRSCAALSNRIHNTRSACVLKTVEIASNQEINVIETIG
jgi:hypothetical protein